MSEEDLPRVAQIEAATFPSPWPIEALGFELTENPFCSAFVMELEDGIAAYAFVWVIYEQAHLVNIAVAEEHRGAGLGEALLVHVLRHSKGQGAERIHLEVREGNVAAIRLYEKYGFEIIGRGENYYSDGTPALFMEAELKEP